MASPGPMSVFVVLGILHDIGGLASARDLRRSPVWM